MWKGIVTGTAVIVLSCWYTSSDWRVSRHLRCRAFLCSLWRLSLMIDCWLDNYSSTTHSYCVNCICWCKKDVFCKLAFLNVSSYLIQAHWHLPKQFYMKWYDLGSLSYYATLSDGWNVFQSKIKLTLIDVQPFAGNKCENKIFVDCKYTCCLCPVRKPIDGEKLPISCVLWKRNSCFSS